MIDDVKKGQENLQKSIDQLRADINKKYQEEQRTFEERYVFFLYLFYIMCNFFFYTTFIEFYIHIFKGNVIFLYINYKYVLKFKILCIEFIL